MTRETLRGIIAGWHRDCTRRPGGDPGQTRDLHPVSWFSPAMLHAGPGHELVIILKTKGCTHHLSDEGGCTVCGYNKDSVGHVLDPGVIVQQFEEALNKHASELHAMDHVVLKIFNSGSFFDDEEIPAGARIAMAERISRHPSITEIAIESRPEFISPGQLSPFKQALPAGVLVETGIGLESWDDEVRLDLIHKGFDRNAFLQAHDVMKQVGMGTKVYVFLKPPFMSEARALEDAWRSVQAVSALGVSTISINPATIHASTLLERLWNGHQYRTPWLYTIRVLLDRVFSSGIADASTHVLCDPVAGGKPRGPKNCHDRECNARSLAFIKQATDTARTFPRLDPRNDLLAECPCVLEWLDQMDW